MNRGTERSFLSQLFVAVGKAAAYLALFLGWQMAVGVAYSTSITTELMLANPALDYDALYELVYEGYMAKAMEISLLSGLLTLLSVVLFFKVRRGSLRQELLLRPVSGRMYGWCAALAFCLYWLVTVVLAILPAEWMEDYFAAAEGLNQTGIAAILATVVIAPLVEEVIFRGLVFSRLSRAMPGMLAVALSAILFGACHGEMVWFCYAFALGMIFGYITKSTASILPTMLMHFVFNGTNEILVLLGEWTPGIVGWIVIFTAAIGGTAFSAVQVKRAVAAMPASVEDMGGGELSGREDLPEEVSVEPVPRKRPDAVCWDADSGAEHSFPPQMR